MVLKVLSYNIRDGGNDRLPGIAAIIRTQQPDAVALLEATSRANALTLAQNLKMQLAFGEANNGIHVAWLSRLPIQRERNHRLAALAKTLLEIEVAWEGAPLRLFATHLASRWGDHSPCYSRELLRLRTPQRATLAPEGSIQAHFAVQASQGPAP
jgi:exodeoxyribonuclease III